VGFKRCSTGFLLANKRQKQKWYKDKRSHRNESKSKRRETIALKSVATDQGQKQQQQKTITKTASGIIKFTQMYGPMNTCAAYSEKQIESVSQIELNMSIHCIQSSEFPSTSVDSVLGVWENGINIYRGKYLIKLLLQREIGMANVDKQFHFQWITVQGCFS